MRKNLLSLSIAAMIGGLGFASSASAGVSTAGLTAGLTPTTATKLVPTPDGIGHILLVPYFSTQNGNSTLMSIVNTDAVNGKAVKVRFRGAANSDDIFDFQVYLSPGDVWTANVSQGADGKSMLTTADNSCMIPDRNVVNTTPFVVSRLPAATANEWTREGYVEIFNMADIPPTLAGTATVNPLFTAVKHVAGIAPGCPAGATTGAALLKLIDNLGAVAAAPATVDADAQSFGFNTPTGTLMGGATIINVSGASVAWSHNATALVASDAAGVTARGRIVFSPQKGNVILTTASLATLTNDPLLRTGIIDAGDYDLPDLSTPYVGTAAIDATSPKAQAEALSTALAVKSVSNEFLTNPLISAATDWTFTMPTRRYAVAMNYTATAAPRPVVAAGVAVFNTTTAATDTPASTAIPSTFFTATNAKASGNLICVGGDATGVSTTITQWGQDEQVPAVAGPGFVISPSTIATSAPYTFCGEASVLGFATDLTKSVLGATIAMKAAKPNSTDGWQTIFTPGLAANGLPILGASFQKATGPVVAGKSTNFSVTYPHRFTR